MKQSLTVEIEVPEGYKLVAYRKPNKGDLFLLKGYCTEEIKVFEYGLNWGIACYPSWIVEKVPDPPKFGEVWRGMKTGGYYLILCPDPYFPNGWKCLTLGRKGLPSELAIGCVTKETVELAFKSLEEWKKAQS